MIEVIRPTCTGPSCERDVRAKGLCFAHYLQLQRGVALAPLKMSGRKSRARCTFMECAREAVSRGLCGGHYQQARQGRELSVLRSMVPAEYRNQDGERPCRNCHKWLSDAEFYTSERSRDGLMYVCRRCDRDLRLRRKFGITIDEYDSLLEKQGGVCAICERQPGEASLAVDHDHACCPGKAKSCGKCVRGLLCEDCNRGIGMFSDSIKSLRRAIDYLS